MSLAVSVSGSEGGSITPLCERKSILDVPDNTSTQQRSKIRSEQLVNCLVKLGEMVSTLKSANEALNLKVNRFMIDHKTVAEHANSVGNRAKLNEKRSELTAFSLIEIDDDAFDDPDVIQEMSSKLRGSNKQPIIPRFDNLNSILSKPRWESPRFKFSEKTVFSVSLDYTTIIPIDKPPTEFYFCMVPLSGNVVGTPNKQGAVSYHDPKYQVFYDEYKKALIQDDTIYRRDDCAQLIDPSTNFKIQNEGVRTVTGSLKSSYIWGNFYQKSKPSEPIVIEISDEQTGEISKIDFPGIYYAVLVGPENPRLGEGSPRLIYQNLLVDLDTNYEWGPSNDDSILCMKGTISEFTGTYLASFSKQFQKRDGSLNPDSTKKKDGEFRLSPLVGKTGC